MEILRYAVAAVLAYLLGSVNVGILLTKDLLKSDVRNSGSGNAGATNVARVFGMKMGVFTFLGDVLKTVVAMAVGRLLGGETGAALAGMGCMLGHCFPLFYGFKGGKGVTVGASVALMLDWRFFLLLVAVFFITFFCCRYVSVSSMCCAVAYPFGPFLLHFGGLTVRILCFFIMALVLFMHRGNIARLIRGTEPKFRAKK